MTRPKKYAPKPTGKQVDRRTDRQPPRPAKRRAQEARGPNPRREETVPNAAPNAGDRRQTHWDPVAKWYNGWVGKRGSLYHRAVAIPSVMELTDVQPGELVLDLGCGQGVLAPHVLKRGGRYQGVDGSRTLVQLARRHHADDPKHKNDSRQGNAAQFILGDVRKLGELSEVKEGSADVAVFMLSIQDMDPLGEVLKAAAWALKPDGRIVIFMLHPAFRVPRQSGWGFDPGRKLTYRRVDSYLTPRGVPMKAYAEVTSRSSGTTWSFHRPLSLYVNTLNELGFKLERLDEPPDPNIDENTKKETLEIPLFAALRARRSP